MSVRPTVLVAMGVTGAAVVAFLVLRPNPEDDTRGAAPVAEETALQATELPTPTPNSDPAPLLPGESGSPKLTQEQSAELTDDIQDLAVRDTDPIINETRMLRIIDSHGSPVADATIEVWAAEWGDDVPPIDTVLSNGEGLAHITIARATSEVFVAKEGVGTSGIWTARSAPKELQDESIIELRPTGRLSGQVLWTDGTPEAGATLEFVETHGGERGTQPRPLAPQVTDPSGRFDIEVDAPLFTHIEVRARDRVAPPRLAHVEAGELEELTLKLPAFTITGMLVGISGKQLREPTVAAGNRTKPEIDGTIDENGAFSVELTEPASYSVRAHATGLVQDQQLLVQVDDQTPAARVEIRLVPEATVTGTVRWSNGAPLPSAMITTWPVRDRRSEGEPEHATFRAHAWTGSDGRFDLRGLHPDLTYSLSVVREAIHKVAVVREVEPGTRDLIVIAEGPLPEHVTLTGEVHDARTGAPVTRFEVKAVRWMHFGYMSMARDSAWYDDLQGRFAIPELQPNGSYAVLIKADGYAPLSHGPINLGIEPPKLSLGLSRWGELRVRVIDHGGDAMAGASVALWPCSPREQSNSTQPLGTDDADASGWVSWSELSPGSYWVEGATASLRGGPMRVSVPNEGTGEATLTLSDSREEGGLEVTLLEFDGSPAPQMAVRVARLSGVLDTPPNEQPRWTCETDSAGSFRQAVPPGAYSLESSRSGLFAFSGRIFVTAGEWVKIEMRLR